MILARAGRAVDGLYDCTGRQTRAPERVDFSRLPKFPLLTSTEGTRGMSVPRPTGRSEHQIRSIHPDAAIDDSNAESVQSTRRRSEYVPSESVEHRPVGLFLEPPGRRAVANRLTQVRAASVTPQTRA